MEWTQDEIKMRNQRAQEYLDKVEYRKYEKKWERYTALAFVFAGFFMLATFFILF